MEIYVVLYTHAPGVMPLLYGSHANLEGAESFRKRLIRKNPGSKFTIHKAIVDMQPLVQEAER